MMEVEEEVGSEALMNVSFIFKLKQHFAVR
jgi:hypothetical protein